MIKCEECGHRKPDIPFIFQYHTADSLDFILERKTCEACWRRIRGDLRIISYGPMIKVNRKRYERVTVVGEAIKYQGELF